MEIEVQHGAPLVRPDTGTGWVRLQPGFVLENHAEGTRTVPGGLEVSAGPNALGIDGRLVDPAGRQVQTSLAGACNRDTFAGVFAMRMVEGYVNDAAFCLSLEVPFDPKTDHLFIPGVHYGPHPAIAETPCDRLATGEDGALHVAADELPFPAVGVFWPERGSGFLLAFAAGDRTDSNGLHLWPEPGSETLRAEIACPALPAARYRHGGWQQTRPLCNYLGEGGTAGMPVRWGLFPCDAPRTFYEEARKLRRFDSRPACAGSLPLSSAAELIEENLNERHWHQGIFLSRASGACGEPEPSPEGEGFPDLWHIRHDTGGGAPLAYALSLSNREQTRTRACAMLDHIAADGLAPSGLFYSAHNRWAGLGDPPWAHLGGATHACLAVLRACERHGEAAHPQWRNAARTCCDALVELLRDQPTFGHAAARNAPLQPWQAGGAAGALGIACLAVARAVFDRDDYLDAALQAADGYAQLLATGRLFGACVEAEEVQESASALALCEGFTALYEETRDRTHLQQALTAADIFATWVVEHPHGLPAGTDLAAGPGSAQGTVVQTAASPHAMPGPGPAGMGCLLRLYQATGEMHLLRLISEIARAMPCFVSRYHADLGALRRGAMPPPFALGSFGPEPGEVEGISDSGAAQGLLLAHHDLPGIYIDPPREAWAIFDAVDAEVDFEERRVYISNPTLYPSRGVLRVEVGAEGEYDLLPGATDVFEF
jgi:hypothetical protein